jgi:hypothetical protein
MKYDEPYVYISIGLAVGLSSIFCIGLLCLLRRSQAAQTAPEEEMSMLGGMKP